MAGLCIISRAPAARPSFAAAPGRWLKLSMRNFPRPGGQILGLVDDQGLVSFPRQAGTGMPPACQQHLVDASDRRPKATPTAQHVVGVKLRADDLRGDHLCGSSCSSRLRTIVVLPAPISPVMMMGLALVQAVFRYAKARLWRDSRRTTGRD
jgi:hypothetical protein